MAGRIEEFFTCYQNAKKKSQKAWKFPANCLYIFLIFAKRKKACAGPPQKFGLSGWKSF
jgi:hypothetical protein